MDPLRGDELATDMRLVTRAVRVSAPALRAALRAMDPPRTVWAAPGEPTVLGGGAAAVLTASGKGRFATVRKRASDLLESVDAGSEMARPRLFGGFAFHDDHERAEPWRGFPGAQFVLPHVQLTYGAGTDQLKSSAEPAGHTGGAWLTVNAVDTDPETVETTLTTVRDEIATLPDPGPIGTPPGIAGRERPTARDDWRASVEAAVDRIEAGELRKVVLAQALRTELDAPLGVGDALARLADRYPDCCRFLFEPHGDDGSTFFGATPEQLVRLRGRTVETGALAGTTGRGDTPEEDEWLARELQNDPKNLHEHELVVEAVHDQLHPVASSVVTGERSVRRLANVQHLRTPITAELSEPMHVLSLVEALHPTPAVGGLPPDRALATIRETEPFDRGWYAAPIGWFDAAGYGSFAVGLRSAIAVRRRATLFAGVGIVADSNPDSEWDEVQLKYRPILDVLE